MAYWYVGDEEYEDKRFNVRPGGIPAGLGLYVAAGSMCMSKIRGRRYTHVPTEWLVADEWINGQCNGPRIARALVRSRIWERREGERGYRFKWIRPQNTPAAVLEHRAGDRRRHTPKPNSSHENRPNSCHDV